MAEEDAARRPSHLFHHWLGPGVVAALVAAGLEVGVVVAEVPMAGSDALGLVHLVVAVLGLYGAAALAIAVFGALIEARLRPRLPDASELLAAAVGALVLVAGAAAIYTQLLRVVNFRFRAEAFGLGLGVGFTFSTLLGVRYVLRPFSERLLLRHPSLARSRLYLVTLLTIAAFVGQWLTHFGLAALHEPTLAGLSGVLVLGCFVLAARLGLPRMRRRQTKLLLSALLAALLVMALASFRHPHTRFVLFSHAHAVSSLAELTENLLDFDRDGTAASFAGGGDCAAFDPTRGPAMREVPADGIDQDCRGGDAPALLDEVRAVDLWPDCRVTRPLSVVLVTVDCLRADALDAETTPHLFQLGRQALDFERAYAPATITIQSIPSLFAAAPVADRADENPLVQRRTSAYGTTLAERFGAAGYRTAAFQDMALPPAALRGFAQVNPHPVDPPPGYAFDDTRSATLTNAALELLRSIQNERSFVWIHYADAHAPHIDPMNRLDSGSEHDFYEREVAYVDFHLGRLLVALAELGSMDHTLLAVTADHGEDFGLRGREGHGPDLFEDTIHVPLLLWVPGCRPRKIEHPVSLLGLGPTLGALAGVIVPGRPLFPGADSDQVPVVSEAKIVMNRVYKRAVMDGRYKLIVDVRRGGRVLFDLEADPGETRNLYSKEPAIASRMEAAYQRWLDHPGRR